MINVVAVTRLAPGKLADIIVVAGDPREDMTAMGQVVLVIKGGQVVDVRSERLFWADCPSDSMNMRLP